MTNVVTSVDGKAPKNVYKHSSSPLTCDGAFAETLRPTKARDDFKVADARVEGSATNVQEAIVCAILFFKVLCEENGERTCFACFRAVRNGVGLGLTSRTMTIFNIKEQTLASNLAIILILILNQQSPPYLAQNSADCMACLAFRPAGAVHSLRHAVHTSHLMRKGRSPSSAIKNRSRAGGVTNKAQEVDLISWIVERGGYIHKVMSCSC
eukprot:4439766-Pyramimonas_sp.AAC.1